MQANGQFKVPGAVWWIFIPIIIGAVMPVIAQFYPTNEFFWSALVVAIGGAIVAAIQAYRSATTPGTTTPVSGPQPSAMSAPNYVPAVPRDGDDYTVDNEVVPEKSFATKWLLG